MNSLHGSIIFKDIQGHGLLSSAGVDTAFWGMFGEKKGQTNTQFLPFAYASFITCILKK